MQTAHRVTPPRRRSSDKEQPPPCRPLWLPLHAFACCRLHTTTPGDGAVGLGVVKNGQLAMLTGSSHLHLGLTDDRYAKCRVETATASEARRRPSCLQTNTRNRPAANLEITLLLLLPLLPLTCLLPKKLTFIDSWKFFPEGVGAVLNRHVSTLCSQRFVHPHMCAVTQRFIT